MRLPAIFWSFLHLRPLLRGQRFTIRADHCARRWTLNLADSTGQIARWRHRLSAFDFEAIHCSGIKNHNADDLSQLSTTSKDESALEEKQPLFAIKNVMKANRFGISERINDLRVIIINITEATSDNHLTTHRRLSI